MHKVKSNNCQKKNHRKSHHLRYRLYFDENNENIVKNKKVDIQCSY